MSETRRPPNLAGKRIVLDCRWLGLGGAGRVTELLLRELRDAPPSGKWILWGQKRLLSRQLFDRAELAECDTSPLALYGQAAMTRVPSGDVVVYMHQIRPIRLGRSVTFIHDTIPLRFAGSGIERRAKWLYLWAVARASSIVLTDSTSSELSLVRDLRVQASRIRTVRFPLDDARVERVKRLSETLPRKNQIMFLGRFAPHKNLRALCRAFQLTALKNAGGRLVVAGGSDLEVTNLKRWLSVSGIDGVDVVGQTTEAAVDELFATSLGLVQPSLEEGYGLPAFEAAACGLPVAVSPTGAMSLLGAAAVYLDPLDGGSIASALDQIAIRPIQDSFAMATDFAQDVLHAIADTFRS